MTTLREAAQQALEALEDFKRRGHWGDFDNLTGTLQAALEADDGMYGAKALTKAYENGWNAAKAEPVQEPVAWMVYTEGGTSAYVTDNPNDLVGAYRALPLYTAPPQRKPEPNSDYERGFVDGMSEQARRSVDKAVNAMTKCKPLAEEEIARLVTNDMVKFARAIERAHGIK